MRGHAVHRRRHAVLAHAVMDIAAGIIAAGAPPSGPWSWCCSSGVRSAEPPTSSGTTRRERVEHRPRGLARRDLGVGLAKLVAERGDRIVEAGGQLAGAGGAGIRRACSAGERLQPRLPGRARRGAARAGLAPCGDGSSSGMTKGGEFQPSRSRAPAISSAPSARAVRRRGAGLGRRAKADDRAAGDQARPVALVRALDRGGDRVGVVAVDALGMPSHAARKRSDLVVGDGELGRRRRWRSRLSSQNTISLSRRRWPASESASWLMPFHQAAVAGRTHRCGDRPARRRTAAASRRSAIAMPTALPRPWPERAGGRLDAARMAALGMAGGAAAELAEALDLVDRHVGIAGQVQQRVEQHRAVPGRQHEAVAVGPVRRRRIEAADIW